jgi:hypothetical protein
MTSAKGIATGVALGALCWALAGAGAFALWLAIKTL